MSTWPNPLILIRDRRVRQHLNEFKFRSRWHGYRMSAGETTRAGTGGGAGGRAPRRLVRKYAVSFILVVSAGLVVNSAIDFWFSFQESKDTLISLQHEKADAAAGRVEGFIDEIRQQIGWTTNAQWAAGLPEQRKLDFVRLLRQEPAITELAELNGAGKEQLRISRLAINIVGSGADVSSAPAFIETRANDTWLQSRVFSEAIRAVYDTGDASRRPKCGRHGCRD